MTSVDAGFYCFLLCGRFFVNYLRHFVFIYFTFLIYINR